LLDHIKLYDLFTKFCIFELIVWTITFSLLVDCH